MYFDINIDPLVVYEDDDVIVIDKPPGLVVHPAAGNADGTLVNALLAHCKGSLSGIFPGQPVLDAHAVMGQVTHVTPMTSTVLLITDASHALPVQVDRNGLRTIAFGTGRIHELELPHLPNNADIREGDQLVTSGLGGRFPPGYPVARVSRIEHRPGEPFASIVATPSAHLERSREVLLVWTLASTLAEAEAAARADKGFVEAPPETPTGPVQIPAEPPLP